MGTKHVASEMVDEDEGLSVITPRLVAGATVLAPARDAAVNKESLPVKCLWRAVSVAKKTLLF